MILSSLTSRHLEAADVYVDNEAYNAQPISIDSDNGDIRQARFEASPTEDLASKAL